MKKILFIILLFTLTSLGFSQDIEMWGMTSLGGDNNNGTIFKTDSTGNNQSVQYSFETQITASSPMDKLLLVNGKMYGLTGGGGAENKGVLFEYDPLTESYTSLIDFDGVNKGTSPRGGLTLGSNGKLYGVTELGGANSKGVIFEYEISSNTFTKLYDFTSVNSGFAPTSSLTETSPGIFYGLTSFGGLAQSSGQDGKGVLYEYNTNTNTYIKHVDFNNSNTGFVPESFLFYASNSKLYGLTKQGGINNNGVLFEFNPSTDVFTKKIDFEYATTGSSPRGSLIEVNNKLYALTASGGLNLSGTLFEYDFNTNILITKVNFDNTNTGASPQGTLLAVNDTIYGLTSYGGLNNDGTLFEFNLTNNIFTKQIDFDRVAKGKDARGTLIEYNNKLYGYTSWGGSGDRGVLFEYEISTNILEKKIDFNFSSDGTNPYGSLVQSQNGNLYGLTFNGGLYSYGTLFEFNPQTNIFTKKADFDGINGASPYGSLTIVNEKIYGLTASGGLNDFGVLFEFNPEDETFTKKIDFNGTNNGKEPDSDLLLADNDKLYGVTYYGGSNDLGTLFEYDITTNILTKKIDFDSLITGTYPQGKLIQANNGKIYGMASNGGINDKGVLFEYDITNNTLSKKVEFDGTNLGSTPLGGLMQAENDNLYGYTRQGGTNNFGTLFEYNIENNLITKKYDFDLATIGGLPSGTPIENYNGKLYGLTQIGGNNQKGSIFEYNISSNVLSKTLDFNGVNGEGPITTSLLLTGKKDTTSINNSIKKLNSIGFKINPNPFESNFKILFTKNIPSVSIEIYDILGKLYFSKLYENISKNSIDLDAPKGVYIIKINTDEQSYSSKIMLKK